jgi:heme/copper-type cytochrome/quinol oxidase subunit 3
VEVHAPADATEPAEVFERTMAVGARIAAAAVAFFFIAFLFAFFYLRALDSNGKWNQHGLDPGQAWGLPIFLCVVGSVGVFAAAVWSLRRDAALWRPGSFAALGLGLAAVVLQSVQYTQLAFGPADGGYASVFVGWTGLYAVFMLGVLYWLETQVAQTLREGDAALPLIRPSAEALRVVWFVLGLVGLVAYILLYLVR